MKISRLLVATLVLCASSGHAQEEAKTDSSQTKKTTVKKGKQLKKLNKQEAKKKPKEVIRHSDPCPPCGMG